MGLEKPVISIVNNGGENKVKHIQRGLVSSGTLNGKDFTIPLSGFTNIDKMFVILNGDAHANNSSVYTAVYVKSLSLDSLVVGANEYTNAYYQVIEFE